MNIEQIEKWAEKNTSPKMIIEKKMITAWTDALLNSTSVEDAVSRLNESVSGTGTDFVLINSIEKASAFMQQMDGLKNVLGYILFNHDDISLKLMCRNIYGSTIHGNGRTIYLEKSPEAEDLETTDSTPSITTDMGLVTDGLSGMIFIIVANPIHTYKPEVWSEIWKEMDLLADDGITSNKIEDIASALVPGRTELVVPPTWLMGSEPRNTNADAIPEFYQCNSHSENTDTTLLDSKNFYAMTVHHSKLYASAGLGNTGEVIRCWSQDGTYTDIAAPGNDGDNALLSYGNKLYFGSWAQDPSEQETYPNGLYVLDEENETFNAVWENNDNGVLSLAGFNGRMYAFIRNKGLCYSLREPVSIDDFVPVTFSGLSEVFRMITFNNRLYAVSKTGTSSCSIFVSENGNSYFREVFSTDSMIYGITVINGVIYVNVAGTGYYESHDGLNFRESDSAFNFIDSVEFRKKQYLLLRTGDRSGYTPCLQYGQINYRNPSITVGDTELSNPVHIDDDSVVSGLKTVETLDSMYVNTNAKYFRGFAPMGNEIWAVNAESISGSRDLFYRSDGENTFTDTGLTYTQNIDIDCFAHVYDPIAQKDCIFFAYCPSISSQSSSTECRVFYTDGESVKLIYKFNADSSITNATMVYWNDYLIITCNKKMLQFRIVFDKNGYYLILDYEYTLGNKVSAMAQYNNMLYIGTCDGTNQLLLYYIPSPGTSPKNISGFVYTSYSGTNNRSFDTYSMCQYGDYLYIAGKYGILTTLGGTSTWTYKLVLMKYDGLMFTTIDDDFIYCTSAAVHDGYLYMGGSETESVDSIALKRFDGMLFTDVTVNAPESGNTKVITSLYSDKTGLYISVRGASSVRKEAIQKIGKEHYTETIGGDVFNKNNNFPITANISTCSMCEYKNKFYFGSMDESGYAIRSIYSEDGKEFTTLFNLELFKFCIFNNTLFGTDGSSVFYSYDGYNFNSNYVVGNGLYRICAFKNKLYVNIAGSWILLVSNNGYDDFHNVYVDGYIIEGANSLFSCNDRLYLTRYNYNVSNNVSSWSTDGENFTDFPTNILSDALDMIFFKGKTYIGASTLYEADDGITFTENQNYPGYAIVCFYEYEGTLYIGTDGHGILKTVDGTVFEQISNDLFPTDYIVLSICSYADRLYAFARKDSGYYIVQGLYQTEPPVEVTHYWKRTDSFISADYHELTSLFRTAAGIDDETSISSMALFKGKLYVCDMYKLYSSTDGANFTEVAGMTSEGDSRVVYSDGDTLYVGTESDGLYTSDDGNTFTHDSAYPDSLTFTCMCSYGGSFFVGTSEGIFKDGEQVSSTDVPHSYVRDMNIWNEMLFIAVGDYIYRYNGTDYDMTSRWTGSHQSHPSFDKITHSLCVYRTTLYAGTENGLYYWGQFSQGYWAWSPAPISGTSSMSIVSLCVHNKKLYIGCTDGFYTYDGITVEKVSDMPDNLVTEIYEYDDSLYVGTSGNGLLTTRGAVTVSAYSGVSAMHLFIVDGERFSSIKDLMMTKSIGERIYFWAFWYQ